MTRTIPFEVSRYRVYSGRHRVENDHAALTLHEVSQAHSELLSALTAEGVPCTALVEITTDGVTRLVGVEVAGGEA